MRKPVRLGFLSLAVSFLTLAATAQQAPPSGDTFTSSANPTQNFGKQGFLAVGPHENTYISFNLSDVPPGSQVSKATLRLFVDSVTTGGQFDVYELQPTPTWSESTLTYKSTAQPLLGPPASTANPIAVSSTSLNNFLLIDITPTVQGWLTNPASNNGIALVLSSAKGQFFFDSKEGVDTSHEPELEIELETVAGPQGPQGPTGPQGPAGPVGPSGPTGSTGASGATGPQGPAGPAGPTGAAGANGTNGTGFTFKQTFSESGGYQPYDVVTYNGSTYMATAAVVTNGATPDQNASWTLLAQAGAAGAAGPAGPAGPTGPPGTNGTNGTNGAPGAQGPPGPQGPAGVDADTNARMIFPSFFPGNLSGTWTGGQLTIDQAITILRVAVTAKTPTGASCPAAVFRFTDGTKGQDLVLTPGAYWSDSGPIVMTFAANSTLKSTLRMGSTCPSNTGADANLLVEYKMMAAGDTDTCPTPQTLCGTYCVNTNSDPSDCGACGTVCPSGQACVSAACAPGGTGTPCTTNANCASGFCVAGLCSACASGQTQCSNVCVNTQNNLNNCGACGNACPSSPANGTEACTSGACGVTCNSSYTACNGQCVNTATDNNNCGTCLHVCPNGQACSAGACAATNQTVGGTVSGLAAGDSFVLQDNGGNNLSVSANGSFTFTTPVAVGATYAVTVLANPSSPAQTCIVTNGSGTVGGLPVTSVTVTCTTNKYTIGGTVSGLAGTGFVLQDNGGNNLTVTTNGTFTFSNSIASGGTYAVTVLTNPSSPTQTCIVSNGSGTVSSSNVTNIAVTCSTNKYTIGGTLSGLAANDSVVLQDDGADNLTLGANGAFTFVTSIPSGGTYAVTVLTNPSNPSQTCVVNSGSGTVGVANVTNVTVTCTTNACPAQTTNFCVLTTTNSGNVDTGTCSAGYSGSCSFACSNGTWTQVTDTCAPNP